jgi:phenylacetate-CoA ligase
MSNLFKDLLQKVEDAQWFTPERIRQIQYSELQNLLKHHKEFSPWYSEFTKDKTRIPIITKKDIQDAGDRFYSTQVPKIHLPASKVKTSGSTGEPLEISTGVISSMFYSAYTLRATTWYKHHTEPLKLSAIKANIYEYIEADNWHSIVDKLYKTGRMQGIPLTTDIVEQSRLLTEFQPNIIMTYPNNIRGLCELWRDNYPLTELKYIKTMGETCTDDLRVFVKEVTGLDLIDMYSSQEIGTIAIQCPESGLYHTMDENLIVEILDDNDQECVEGQIGKVVITDLHNAISPMIRYQIGDYAVRGGKCSCGRGLKTISQILGRNRNLLVHPDGRKNWPLVGFYKFMNVTKVRRFQFIQHDLENIELRVATDHEMTDEERTKFIEIGHEFMGPEFNINIVHYLGDLPPNKNGKYEDFISYVK